MELGGAIDADSCCGLLMRRMAPGIVDSRAAFPDREWHQLRPVEFGAVAAVAVQAQLVAVVVAVAVAMDDVMMLRQGKYRRHSKSKKVVFITLP